MSDPRNVNALVSFTPEQWAWIQGAAARMSTDPFTVLQRLLELGQPALQQQLDGVPKSPWKLTLVR